MSDGTRITYGHLCPVSPHCPWHIAGYPHPELADLERDWHLEHHHDKVREADFIAEDAHALGLLCDPPAIPAPRVRDLTVVGLTRSVLRVLWGWAK